MAEKRNNRITITIILLLLALVIYYVYKQMQVKRSADPTYKCCNPFNEFYSESCIDDPNCNCDDSLCQQDAGVDDEIIGDDIFTSDTDGGIQTSGCCEGVAYNYDPNCLTDPNCNCDMSLCTSEPVAAHTCYSNCTGANFSSLYTTIPCGTGAASGYPNSQAPYCASNEA